MKANDEVIKRQIKEAKLKVQKTFKLTDPMEIYKRKSPNPKTLTKLSPEDKTELYTILDNLNGSKNSIVNANVWVTKHGSSCIDIAHCFLNKVRTLGDFNFDQKLFILYLINDILHECLCKRTIVHILDSMSLSLLNFLPEILSLSYCNSGKSEREKIVTLLDLWYDRLIFNRATIVELKRRMIELTPQKNKEDNKLESIDTLHISPGYLVDLVRGHFPYQEMDNRRIPLKQENVPLEPNDNVFMMLEVIERELGEIDPSLKKSVLDYRRKFYS